MYETFILIVFGILFFRVFHDLFIRGIFLVMLYPMVYLAYMANGGEPTRLVSIWEAYYSDSYRFAFWLYFFSIVAFFIPFYSRRHTIYRIVHFRSTGVVYLLVAIAFALSAVVSYPWVFGLSGHRESILPGNAWNSFYVVSFAFLVFFYERRHWTKLLAVTIVPFGIVAYGERADTAMILVIAMILLLTSRIQFSLMSRRRLATISFIGAILFFGLLAAGEYRDHGEVTLSGIDRKLLAHPTVVDATHVFYSAVWYYSERGPSQDPVTNIAYSFIPFHPLSGAGSEFSTSNFLKPFIDNAGGALFVTPFYLAGGVPYALCSSFFLGFLVRLVWAGHRPFQRACFFIVFLLAFRAFWYGPFYVFKPLYVLALAWVGYAFLKTPKHTLPARAAK